jgi:hypothetical protein
VSYHREYAEHLLTNPPVDEFGRHFPATILSHAILALIDKLDEVPLVAVVDEADDD